MRRQLQTSLNAADARIRMGAVVLDADPAIEASTVCLSAPSQPGQLDEELRKASGVGAAPELLGLRPWLCDPVQFLVTRSGKSRGQRVGERTYEAFPAVPRLHDLTGTWILDDLVVRSAGK
jgi:hypothetical protein